jgi:predicted RNA-binding Zn-ribbon protein involved in translation (DUF1610 family)
MSALTAPHSTHTDPQVTRHRPERMPVSASCPACGRTRLIYTAVRRAASVTLICPGCRGTSAEPRG